MRSLVIHAIGAFSGLGVDAPSTMGCLLTKVSVRSELSLRGGTTMGAAIVYEPKPRGINRLIDLALSALDEVAEVDLPWPLPLILCCPGSGEIACRPEELLARLGAEDSSLIAAGASQVIHGGRTNLHKALASADKVLASQRWPACVVLAVDSLFDPSRLMIVDARRGLRSVDRPQGVLPGEAAVALLLGPGDRFRTGPRIVALTAGQSPAGAQTGVALAALVDRALAEAGVAANQVTGLAHDMTSTAGIEELNSMMNRLPLASVTSRSLYAPCETAGETGASTSLLTLATTAFFLEKGVYQAAGLAIASDDSGFRSVAVVTMEGGKG
jgi:3-oxoacyl-[acyl-carrier-protein] synthase-1